LSYYSITAQKAKLAEILSKQEFKHLIQHSNPNMALPNKTDCCHKVFQTSCRHTARNNNKRIKATDTDQTITHIFLLCVDTQKI